MCSAVQPAGGGAPLRSRALLYFSLCEETQPSEMCLEGFLVCVCVSYLNVLGCLRYGDECEGRRGESESRFASLNSPLLVFALSLWL